jgi:hypothetical protein
VTSEPSASVYFTTVGWNEKVGWVQLATPASEEGERAVHGRRSLRAAGQLGDWRGNGHLRGRRVIASTFVRRWRR